MTDKPTPEEQLLRLIEGEEVRTFTAAPKEKPVASAEATALSVSERFQNISRWFSYKRVNIKLVNRVLTVITVGLSVYLIWSMTQKPLSSDEIIGNIRKGIAFDVKSTTVPTIPYDTMDIKKVLDIRKSIFIQVEKAPPPPPPPPPPVIVNPPTTPPNTSNVQVIPPNQIIEEIKRNINTNWLVLCKPGNDIVLPLKKRAELIQKYWWRVKRKESEVISIHPEVRGKLVLPL